MPIPNDGLITETNRQYYEGAQGFVQSTAGNLTFLTTFNTDLIYGSSDPNNTNYALNNYKLYTSPTGLPGTFVEVVANYSVLGNTIVFTTGNAPALGTYLVVQLKMLIPRIGTFTNTAYDIKGIMWFGRLNGIVTFTEYPHEPSRCKHKMAGRVKTCQT